MPEENAFNDVGQQQSLADKINGYAANFASSLGSSFVNGGFGLLSQYLQDRYNVKNWEMQNEYNLPANQMERYKQAGISPSAAAQAITGGNGAQSAEIHAAGSATPLSGNPFLDALSQNRQYMLDKRLAEAEIDRREAEAQNLKSQTNERDWLLPKKASEIDSEIRKNYSVADMNDSLKVQYDYGVQRAKRFEQKEFERLGEEIKETIERTKLLKQQARTEVFKQDLMFEEAENVRQDTENKKKIGKNLEYENNLNAWKELYRNFMGSDPDAPLARQFLQQCAQGEENAIRVWEALLAYCDVGMREIAHYGKEHPALTGFVGANYLLNKYSKFVGANASLLHNLLPFFAGGSVVAPFNMPSGPLVRQYIGRPRRSNYNYQYDDYDFSHISD